MPAIFGISRLPARCGHDTAGNCRRQLGALANAAKMLDLYRHPGGLPAARGEERQIASALLSPRTSEAAL